MDQATLLVTCPDRPGLVAATARLLFEAGANIVHADQHLDRETATFFQRIQCDTRGCVIDRATLERRLGALARELSMTWQLVDADQLKRTAILVSRLDHCLYDLLLRQRAGELRTTFVCVISNHPDAAAVAEDFGLPFHHLPVTAGDAPGPGSGAARAAPRVRGRPGRARPLHADPVQPVPGPARAVRRSTSTTASCPPSAAASPMSARTSAG